MLEWYATHFGNISIVYGIVVTIITGIISHRSYKYFELSSHTGLRLIATSFLAFCVGFALVSLRYINSLYLQLPIDPYLQYAFEVAICLAGFYIVYSLMWKRIYFPLDFTFFVLAFCIALVDYIVASAYQTFMYLSQLIVLSLGIGISYHKSCMAKKAGKHTFLRMYFYTLVLMFFGYLINFINVFVDAPWFSLLTRITTLTIFLIFLYGTSRKCCNHGKKA